MKITESVTWGRAPRSAPNREWMQWAIRQIEADFARSSDTHLIKLPLPLLATNGIDLYLKDESTHPSGSLKHRLARSLFLYGLANGRIHEGCPIVEASSGSTAISEAYFARLLELPFIAVAPSTTAQAKLDAITFLGGQIHLTDPACIYADAQRIARESGGYYMDQFTYAERATDWRSNNNIAESLFAQMRREPHPVPAWVVVSAGTGGTSSTIGRYIRYKAEEIGSTKLCVVDPENSVFYDFFASGDDALTLDCGSRIEGIGRPRVEASFIPSVVDAMIKVPDAASVATIHWLETIMARRCGGSTGTNVFGALAIAAQMIERGERGSIVTILCDSGDRYATTYYNPRWITEQQLDTAPYLAQLEAFSAA